MTDALILLAALSTLAVAVWLEGSALVEEARDLGAWLRHKFGGDRP